MIKKTILNDMTYALVLCSILLTLVGGCVGKDDNNSSGQVVVDPNSETASVFGQALLGPIVDAQVEIYDVNDTESGPVCTSVTTDNVEFEQAGIFIIPEGYIVKDNLYIIVVNGGLDIDVDDDGIRDGTPKSVLGNIHAVLTGEQLLNGDSKVTALTEATYQQVEYLIAAKYQKDIILSVIDQCAKRMLREDLSGDGQIDHLDLTKWHPRYHSEVFRRKPEDLEKLLEAIHGGESTRNAALSLSSPLIHTLYLENSGSGFKSDLKLLNDIIYYVHSDGLKIIDVSDNYNPQVLSSITTPGDARRVFVQNNTAYIADGESGIQIVDVSAPSQPVLISEIDTMGIAEDVELFNNYAYIANKNLGLQVIDVSVPENPIWITTVNGLGELQSLTILNGTLYLAAGTSGVIVIDITVPSDPTLLKKISGPNMDYALDIFGKNNMIYVANSVHGLSIVDVSDPGNPTVINMLTYADTNSQSVFVDDNTAYIADVLVGLQIVDVTDANHPFILGAVNADSGFQGGIHIENDIAYLSNGSGLKIIDVLDVTEVPTVIGALETMEGQSRGIDVVDNKAYMGDSSKGLQVIDAEDPSQPFIVSSLQTMDDRNGKPDFTRDVTVSRNLAYIGFYGLNNFNEWQESGGIDVVDVSDASNLKRLGRCYTGIFPQKIIVKENNAFIIGYCFQSDSDCSMSKLQIIDVSDASYPTLTGELTLNSAVLDIDVAEKAAYIAAGHEGIILVDISDPSRPYQVTTVSQSSYVQNVRAVQDVICVVESDAFKIFNVSNPFSPEEVGIIDNFGPQYYLVGDVSGLAIKGDIVYIANNQKSIHVVSISDISSPKIIGSIATRKSARAVEVFGDIVYVIETNGLSLLKAIVQTTP